jgi:2-methylcitrate dehydratase PrpD
MTELAKQAADFIVALNPAMLPPRCTDAARMGIADCVGVMIAGANERAPRIVAKLVPSSTSMARMEGTSSTSFSSVSRG